MAMPMGSEVRAFAPATVANLGPGFDVLGLALHGPGDTVLARRVPGHGVRMAAVRGDDGILPTDAAKNCAGIAAQAVLTAAGVDIGVELELDKGLPIGSGAGSSAASAAAAAMATNLLIGGPLRKRQLVGPCIEAEAVVSGRHADNVAPALLGGLVLVRSVDPLDLVRLPIPAGLFVVLITPDLRVDTKDARAVLPDRIPLSMAVTNQANLAAFVSACYSGDLALLGRCVVDAIATPERARLAPGSQQAMDAALDAGALGSSLSGSGPSVFALCRSARSAADVSIAMQAAFASVQVTSTATTSPADCPGARRL
jgi:homoserine kinase